MRIKTVIVTAVAVFMAFIHQPVFAKDVSGLFGFGAKVSYVNISDTDLSQFNLKFDDSVSYGLNFTYFFTRYFSLELGVEHLESHVNVNGGGFNDFYFGDVTQIPIMLTARAHLPVNDWITPYLGGGAGYYSNDFDLSLILTNIITFDPESSIGYHVNGGVELFVSDKVSFQLDVKYVWNTPEFKFSGPIAIPPTAEVDLNWIIVGLGIRYYFK